MANPPDKMTSAELNAIEREAMSRIWDALNRLNSRMLAAEARAREQDIHPVDAGRLSPHARGDNVWTHPRWQKLN